MSKVWNIFKEKLGNNQTLTTFLLCPVEDINISDFFLPNLKIPNIIMGFNNHN